MSEDQDITGYPLQWPVGWRRTAPDRRRWSQFRSGTARVTMTDALDRVQTEFARWGIHDVVISSNVQVRLDGRIRADQARPSDPGVAIYFRLRAGGRPKVFACDKWFTVEENLAAIAGHIHALRAVERYGVGETE